MSAHTSQWASIDDDKYSVKQCKLTTGCTKIDCFKKYYDLLSLFGGSNLGFVTVYLLLGALYLLMGGHPGHTNIEKVTNFLSISIEALGLLVLRHKIIVRNSVAGISGMTIIMYTVVYTIRIWLAMPENWRNSDFMDLNIDASFGFISLLLALDILRSVFVTHRSTYQYDLDVLHVKYLIPGCCVLALLRRPEFHTWTNTYSFVWSSCLYMDVLALMPQVVMMSCGGGKVEAPIAHFVAATFLSRIEDLVETLLYYWYHNGALQSQERFSYWLVVFVQGMHLLLVVDFMYYYFKARSTGSGLLEDLELKNIVV